VSRIRCVTRGHPDTRTSNEPGNRRSTPINVGHDLVTATRFDTCRPGLADVRVNRLTRPTLRYGLVLGRSTAPHRKTVKRIIDAREGGRRDAYRWENLRGGIG